MKYTTIFEYYPKHPDGGIQPMYPPYQAVSAAVKPSSKPRPASRKRLVCTSRP